MSDPSTSSPQQAAMQEAPSATITVNADEQDHEVPVLKLRLKKPKTGRKVQWSTETVDNEHMNKKKSKCCCIYEKPRVFGEDSDSSDEDDDDECEHCKGHVDKKKHHHEHQPDENPLENPEDHDHNTDEKP